MAEEAKPAGRVAVLDPDGKFGTMDASDVDKLPDGARVLSPKEVKARELDEQYAGRSTVAKVAAPLATAAFGPVVGSALSGTGVTAEDPRVESLQRGMVEPLTYGVDALATKQAAEAIGGKGAGKAYAQRLADVVEAHPEYHTAGEVIGNAAMIFGGGAKGLGTARALPGLGVSALGNAAEAGAARILGSGASSILGRAAQTAGKFAIRGAFEGAAQAGIQHATSEALQDHEIHGTNLFSAMGHGALGGGVVGFGLGGAGSLAASGAKGLGRLGVSAFSRFTRGAEGLEGAGARLAGEEAAPVGAKRLGMGEGPYRAPGEPTTPTPKSGAAPEAAPSVPFATKAEDRARRVANDLAYSSLGATKAVTAAINEELPGKTQAAGDWLNRHVAKPGETSFLGAVGRSRADEILPLVETANAKIGKAIGDEVKARPIRVSTSEVMKPAVEIYDAMLRSPRARPGAEAFMGRIKNFGEAFQYDGKIAHDGTMSLSDLYYARAEMEQAAHELGRGSEAHSAFKTYLRKLDDHLVDRLEQAAKGAGEDGEKIRQLKSEYQIGKAVQRAAESGTNKVLGNNTFGLREGMGAAVGIATGHPLGAAVTAIGGKVVKERGAAMGAWALNQAADRGYVRRIAEFVDGQTSKAAKGLIREAPEVSAPRSSRAKPSTPQSADQSRREYDATLKHANDVVSWIGQTRAQPQPFLDSVKAAGTELGRMVGPRASSSYTASALKALNFVAASIPEKERRDPLDPRSVPPLTHEEAERVVRSATYAKDPPTVWADFAKGIVTPEGLAAAKTFMPDQFAELQTKLFQHVQNHLANNRQLTATQRLNIDKLLGGGAIRPERVAMLQSHLQAPTQEGPPGPLAPNDPAMAGALPPPKPLDMKIQQSGFDAIEARKAG